MTKNSMNTLSDAQLRSELERCEYCEEKPCKEACPADCSPADFIMAAKAGAKSDYQRAAAIILASNPLGGICGAVCPDTLCMKGCVRKGFDHPVSIPAVQATIIKKGKEFGVEKFSPAQSLNKNIAVIGAGPAGLGAAAALVQLGCSVELFEKSDKAGGMCHLIPDFRLDKNVLASDIEFIKTLGDIVFHFNSEITDQDALRHSKKFSAVIVAAGLSEPAELGVPGEEAAFSWQRYLENHKVIDVTGKRVAVIGGGAVAVDCAVTASKLGASHVEMIYRRKIENMPLTHFERTMLLESGVEISSCTKIVAVVVKKKQISGLRLVKMELPPGKSPLPKNFVVSPTERPFVRPFDVVIMAIGSIPAIPVKKSKGIYFAGDIVHGAATVVEAVAAGKNAAAEVYSFLTDAPKPEKEKKIKSRMTLAGRNLRPVPVEADFFGRKILSPFLISAAPHTDGYAQMKKAYEAGWAGGVMKTAFDNLPIHIPSEYMSVIGKSTYGNCDNVSGHPLDRVCREVEKLVKEYPDRLTMASTGGPVTGIDYADRNVWQSNTKKLENAGAMGIEYSLSCPQGGDGTKGDVVSQDAQLTAKIISWVMEVSNNGIPKLFKLTGAVTSIAPILEAIRGVYLKYPAKKAGITLANSFPSLLFRPSETKRWDEGIVIGMSGEGVLPISNLTLAKASKIGLNTSGNGGAMNYKAAADFLALGASTVQFCTLVMKYGLSVVDELHAGLSFLMRERGFASVKELIGSALPQPVTDFMKLSPVKNIPAVEVGLCEHCGNCTRCPYLAITLDEKLVPVIDPLHCVGCSLCVQKCFSGALFMRKRTESELSVMSEG